MRLVSSEQYCVLTLLFLRRRNLAKLPQLGLYRRKHLEVVSRQLGQLKLLDGAAQVAVQDVEVGQHMVFFLMPAQRGVGACLQRV